MFLTITIDTAAQKRAKMRVNKNYNPIKGWHHSFKRSLRMSRLPRYRRILSFMYKLVHSSKHSPAALYSKPSQKSLMKKDSFWKKLIGFNKSFKDARYRLGDQVAMF
jgi:hypothetical protein